MRIIIVLLLSLSFLPSTAQVTINDVKLPAKIKHDDTDLKLNGAGLRKKYWFKIYVLGLYTEQKSTNASTIVNTDKPMGMRLVVTSSMVTSENFAESTREGFKRSLKGKTAPLQSKIDAFIATFSESEIKEGDVYDLWYTPGVGLKSYRNGTYQSTVEGFDFKKALFGIWLGDEPVDEDLHNSLLGK